MNVVAPVPPSATTTAAVRPETVPPVMFALSVAVLAAVKEPVASSWTVAATN